MQQITQSEMKQILALDRISKGVGVGINLPNLLTHQRNRGVDKEREKRYQVLRTKPFFPSFKSHSGIRGLTHFAPNTYHNGRIPEIDIGVFLISLAGGVRSEPVALSLARVWGVFLVIGLSDYWIISLNYWKPAHKSITAGAPDSVFPIRIP